MSEDRITALEEMVAHQTRTIDELSEQVAGQWRIIEQLRRAVEMLNGRIGDMEEPAPATRPPHY